MYDAVADHRRDRRLAKMRGYNATHRAKLASQGVPTARDVEYQGWLMLTRNDHDLARLKRLLVQRLTDAGYDAQESRNVVERIVGSRGNVDGSLPEIAG